MEPVAFRLTAWCLNQLPYRVLHSSSNKTLKMMNIDILAIMQHII
jgi:hypothetical protein